MIFAFSTVQNFGYNVQQVGLKDAGSQNISSLAFKGAETKKC